MILVTGATGNIGRHLVRELADADQPTRALARDPSKADTHGGSVEFLAGDLNDPHTLEAAFKDVNRLFLLSPGPAEDAALIREAQRHDVDHVVMLSSLGAELGGIAGGRLHVTGEQLLQNSELPWTILRPSEFMTNTIWWRDTLRSADAIFVPSGSGRIGFVDPADIASVAATTLTTEGHRATYRLTGPEALSTTAIAAALSSVLGRTIRHRDVSETDFADALRRNGLPAALIEMQTEYYEAVKNDRVAIVTDDIRQLLGHPPRSYREFAERHASAFQ